EGDVAQLPEVSLSVAVSLLPVSVGSVDGALLVGSSCSLQALIRGTRSPLIPSRFKNSFLSILSSVCLWAAIHFPKNGDVSGMLMKWMDLATKQEFVAKK